MSKSIPISMALMIIIGALIILAGCSESARSESDVIVKVVSGGNSGPTTYMDYYEPDEIEDYIVSPNGTLSIYLKDGNEIKTSMFTIETKR